MTNQQRLITLLWQIVEATIAGIVTAFRLLEFVLKKLIELVPVPDTRAVRLEGSFGQPRLKGRGPTPSMIPGSCTNEEEIDALCNPLTAGGQPATIDGDVTWEKLDGDAELGASSDGGKVQTLVSQDAPEVGVSHFRATADADMGQGVTPITMDYELTVNPAGAATLGGGFGTPRLKGTGNKPSRK